MSATLTPADATDPGAAPHAEAGLGAGRVVVGVDGREASVAALAWAMRLAGSRGWTVEVVAAWPDRSEPFVHEVPGHYCVPRARAVARARAAVARASADVAAAGARTGTPPVATYVENAHPVDALLARAADARVLVVGAPAEGHRHARRHGSVAGTCSRLAACPVVVVEPLEPPGTAGP